MTQLQEEYRMLKKKFACMATVMALCGSMLVSAAGYTILEKAQKVESTVYGTVQQGALNDRVASLDKLINGQSADTGSTENRVDTLYKEVYGNPGSDLSMLAAVNMMQWKYGGQVSNDSLLARVSSLEENLNGQVGTGSLNGRVTALRRSLLGNEKFVSQAVTIPAGIIVKLQNLDALSSKTLKKGDTVRLAAMENVMVGNVVAIPSGSQCEGTVTDVRRSGIFGRDGKLVITYGSIKAVDGSAVPLIVGDKAKEQYKQMKIAAGASVAGAVILGPVGLVGGLFVKGSEVNIPAGTTMFTEVKTDTDVMGFTETPVDSSEMKTANMAASGVAVPGVSGVATPVGTQTVAIGPNATTPIATPPAADANMPVGTAQAPTQTVPVTEEKAQETQTATENTQDTSNQTTVAITSNGKQ